MDYFNDVSTAQNAKELRENARAATDFLSGLSEQAAQLFFLASKIGDRLEDGEEVVFDFRNNSEMFPDNFIQAKIVYDSKEDRDSIDLYWDIDYVGQVLLQRVSGPTSPILWYDALVDTIRVFKEEWDKQLESGSFAKMSKDMYRSIPDAIKAKCEKGTTYQVYFEYQDDDVQIIYYTREAQDSYLRSLA